MPIRTRRTDGRLFAFARVYKIRSLQQLVEARKHALREEGARFEIREGAVPGYSRRWVLDGDEKDFPLEQAFKQLKAQHSARERRGAHIAMNIQLDVSPELIEEAGDPYDMSNPMNERLWRAALDFAHNYIGGVFAMRLDLDERGCGVVDVFAAPIFDRQGRRRKDGSSGQPVKEISINKAIDNWRKLSPSRWEYSALQDLWAAHAKKMIDARLERGDRKSDTRRQHLETSEYKALRDKEREQRARDEEIKRVAAEAERVRSEANQQLAILRQERLAAERDREAARREHELKESELQEKIRSLSDLQARLLHEARQNAEKETSLNKASEAAAERDNLTKARMNALLEWLGKPAPRPEMPEVLKDWAACDGSIHRITQGIIAAEADIEQSRQRHIELIKKERAETAAEKASLQILRMELESKKASQDEFQNKLIQYRKILNSRSADLEKREHEHEQNIKSTNEQIAEARRRINSVEEIIDILNLKGFFHAVPPAVTFAQAVARTAKALREMYINSPQRAKGRDIER